MKDKDLVPATFRTPFTVMRRLNDEMERMFEDFGFRRPITLAKAIGHTFDWIPVLEIFERDHHLLVRAELPGLTKDDVKIEIAEGILTIQGERKYEKHEKKDGIFRSERSYGTFFRQLSLPDGVNADTAKAAFKNGILEIEMPIAVKKPAAVRTLKIEEEIEKEKEKELVGA